MLIDPSRREVEVFTLAEAGAWLLTDQSRADALALASIDLRLPWNLVFRGVAGEDS